MKSNREIAEEIVSKEEFFPGSAVETFPGSGIFVNTPENRKLVIAEIARVLDRMDAGDFEEVDLGDL